MNHEKLRRIRQNDTAVIVHLRGLPLKSLKMERGFGRD